MSSPTPEKFYINRLEPVRVNSQLYGKSIEFNHVKSHVKFNSEFHASTHLQFNQIERMTITYDKKRTLLWVGILTLLLFVGFFLLLVRIRLPPWKVHIILKKNPTPIKIRAWLTEDDATYLTEFCTPHFPTMLISKK